jgi:hypothetical protein
MTRDFPIGSRDLYLIKRIIQIPFGLPYTGGKTHKNKRKLNKTRKHKNINFFF